MCKIVLKTIAVPAVMNVTKTKTYVTIEKIHVTVFFNSVNVLTYLCSQ
jgi:hypothetical protein